jgi:hypothetical protein
MIEVPKIVGPVPDMIKQALDYIKTNVIKKRIIKQKDKAESIIFFNYPYQAIEEAVVNACIIEIIKNENRLRLRLSQKRFPFLVMRSGPFHQH